LQFFDVSDKKLTPTIHHTSTSTPKREKESGVDQSGAWRMGWLVVEREQSLKKPEGQTWT
jgi:hypothetical protein